METARYKEGDIKFVYDSYKGRAEKVRIVAPFDLSSKNGLLYQVEVNNDFGEDTHLDLFYEKELFETAMDAEVREGK